MNLKGRVAWVTGGNSGIGAAVTRALVAEGAKVLVTALDEEKGKAIVAEVGEDNAMWLKADNLIREELEAAAAAAVKKWGHLDLLFNSAGGSAGGFKFFYDNEEEKKKAIDYMNYGIALNTMGSFHAAHIAANYMRNNEPDENGERGGIIFVASMAADKIWFWFDERVADTTYTYEYGMSKASILGLSRDLAVTMAHHGIRVNTIKPGYILTPMTAALQGVEKLVWPPMQLFPKVGGQPENIASMAIEIYKNPFINRTQMEVDAGVVG
ncbi:MAG: SDR family NAD(P)-dependent oxidoreductase [Oscillospiraceae bacterium]|nr:SDR family NAD(P)-dependent oxidoreductase [Oscillospiraceae bacterium]